MILDLKLGFERLSLVLVVFDQVFNELDAVKYLELAMLFKLRQEAVVKDEGCPLIEGKLSLVNWTLLGESDFCISQFSLQAGDQTNLIVGASAILEKEFQYLVHLFSELL